MSMSTWSSPHKQSYQPHHAETPCTTDDATINRKVQCTLLNRKMLNLENQQAHMPVAVLHI